jgi:oligopeptide transport system ATP-binding protein
LLASAPVADPEAPVRAPALAGDVPSPLDMPPGCRFASRCPKVMAVCRDVDPVLSELEPEHWVACHLYPRDAIDAASRGHIRVVSAEAPAGRP